MLKTKIKASNISNLTDARYFAAWYVDWLGFDLRSTENTLSLAEVKAIKEWIEGPVIVGEIDLLDFEKAKEVITFLELEAIQVGMYTPVEQLQSLQNYTIIKEVVIEPTMQASDLEAHLAEYFDVVSYFLLDFDKNGIDWEQIKKGTSFSMAFLKKLCQRQEILLSVNSKPTEIDDILENIQPYGLSIKGGIEEKVGFKSFDEVDEIFEILEEE